MVEFQTPEPIAANVVVQVGSVQVIASRRDDTTVVVNPSDPSKPLDVEAAKKTEVDLSAERRLVVKAPKPGGIVGAVLGKYGSVDVTIELPEESEIDVSNGVGDVRIDGRVTETRVKAGAGAVHVDETTTVDLTTGAGNLSLNVARGGARLTAAGEMRIGRVEANAVVKNMNGKTSIEEVSGHLRIKAANGDISIGTTHSVVVAKTDNGSIEIGEVKAGSVNVETGAGSLAIGVREGPAAWVDARTKFGRVDNSLEHTENPGPSEGTVEIRARSAFGDIGIHRAK